MKKNTKKLALSRETFRLIQEDTLAAAPGATGLCTVVAVSVCIPCQTYETASPCGCA